MTKDESTDQPNEAADTTENDDMNPIDGADYNSGRLFSDFPISDEILKGVLEHGYEQATPVQAATIEPALAGKDLIVRAKTGTGKTAAFSLPVLERVEAGQHVSRVLMLSPTRELAQQIAKECEQLAKYKDIAIVTLVGGLPIGPQEDQLSKGPEILVGTPGRVLDHARRGNVDLSTIQHVVLDEADEMLSMGFFEDVTKLMSATAEGRQILLFSATISPETERLVRAFLVEPEQIRLSTDADNVENIHHIIYETDPGVHKVRSLLYVLDIENPTSAIIFCNTREDTATVASFLDRQGLDVQLISGELSQSRRSQVMKRVKSGDVRFLVATDVAARGIDISNLSHVINYALPSDAAVYLHRTGRTGRIGKEGTAISLIGGSDLATHKTLSNKHNLNFTVRELPDAETCVQQRVERQAEQIRSAMSSMVFESYLPTVKAIKDRPDGDALLAAALRAFFQWDRQRRIDASGGGESSVRELLRQRNEKIGRRAERGGSNRKRNDRGRDRKDRQDRSDRRNDTRGGGKRDKGPRNKRGGSKKGQGNAKPKHAAADLDALLSFDD